jgi:hypothetical protein
LRLPAAAETLLFPGDLEYWKVRLGHQGSVKPINKDRCLTFLLTTASDFEFFLSSVTDGLLKAEWSQTVDGHDLENSEGDE